MPRPASLADQLSFGASAMSAMTKLFPSTGEISCQATHLLGRAHDRHGEEHRIEKTHIRTGVTAVTIDKSRLSDQQGGQPDEAEVRIAVTRQLHSASFSDNPVLTANPSPRCPATKASAATRSRGAEPLGRPRAADPGPRRRGTAISLSTQPT